MARIAIVLISVFLTTSAFAQGISDDHQDIFEERLSEIVALSAKPGATGQEVGIAGEKLLQFAKDYPESRYAKDAMYLLAMMGFTGAVTGENKNKDMASKFIEKMKVVINRYPDGALEESTCKKWKEMFGEESSGAVSIPFKYTISYMHGSMGFWFQDYQSVIKNFSFLKEKLDFSKDSAGTLAGEIYIPLAVAYKNTNNFDKMNDTAKEAIERFPNSRAAQFMQKLLDKSRLQ